MDSFVFRRAQLSDMQRIMEMEEQGFDAGNRERSEVYIDRINVFPDGALIAELDSQIVGCIFAEIWSARNEVNAECFTLGHDIKQSHEVGGEWLYISSMTILPEFRGKRIGERLFNGCIDYISSRYSNCRKVILLVNESWENARAIYLKSGFEETHRLSDFFVPYPGIYQDGLIMLKNIAEK